MFRLADMATKVESAHQMMVMAAPKVLVSATTSRPEWQSPRQWSCPSLFISDPWGIRVLQGVRIERLYREAPVADRRGHS